MSCMTMRNRNVSDFVVLWYYSTAHARENLRNDEKICINNWLVRNDRNLWLPCGATSNMPWNYKRRCAIVPRPQRRNDGKNIKYTPSRRLVQNDLKLLKSSKGWDDAKPLNRARMLELSEQPKTTRIERWCGGLSLWLTFSCAALRCSCRRSEMIFKQMQFSISPKQSKSSNKQSKINAFTKTLIDSTAHSALNERRYIRP